MKRYPVEVEYTPSPPRPYLHTLEAGAWLPLAQASIAAVIVAALVLVIALATRARSPLTWCGVAGLLTWSLAWLSLQRHWLSLTNLERLAGRDLDGDGRIGSDVIEPAEVRVRVSQVTEAGHFREDVYPLPATLAELQALAAGLVEGRPLSEREWAGGGRPFSVDGFRTLRAELIRRGLAALTNPKDTRQGYCLTLAGRHVMAGIVEDVVAPSPAEPYQAA